MASATEHLAPAPIGRTPVRDARLQRLAFAAVAIALFLVAYDNGSYGLGSRTTVTVAVWWTLPLALALGLLPRRRPTRFQLAAGSLLLGLAGWTALSALWAWNDEAVVTESTRVILYAGVFALASLATRRADVAGWCDGIALAVTAVSGSAVASQFFPSVISARAAYAILGGDESRLSYPVGYWNGLGILVALGLPALLRAAAWTQSRLTRAAAVAALPLVGTTIYLTSSRGAVVVALVGLVVVLAGGTRRGVALSSSALGAAATGIVIGYLHGHPTILDQPGSRLGVAEGRTAAVVLAAAGVLTAALSDVLWERSASARLATGPRRALLVAAALIVVGGIVVGHPVRRFDAFKAAPSAQASTTASYIGTHLASGSGNGRWQYWASAAHEFEAHPFLGGGAGTFEQWWEQHRRELVFVTNPHSFYLQELGELGLIGFLLAAGTIAVGLVGAGVAVARQRGGDDDAAVAAGAGFAAFAVALALDWMWQLTAVAVVGFVLLALVLRSAAGEERSLSARRGWVAGAAVVGAAAIAFAVLPLLASDALARSATDARRQDGLAAQAAAVDASDLAPWAASPYLQLALVDERLGRLAEARSAIATAIARDRHDWQLWAVRTRLETKSGHIEAAVASLRETKRLNPLAVLPGG